MPPDLQTQTGLVIVIFATNRQTYGWTDGGYQVIIRAYYMCIISLLRGR